MSEGDSSEKISIEKQVQVLNSPPHIAIKELIPLACSRLGKEKCVGIDELGDGAFHFVYRLEFSDGSSVAAKIVSEDVRQRSDSDVDTYNPTCILAEVATMDFVRESGLYPDVPVPKVLAYDSTAKNPICAPYMIMEVVEGRFVNDIEVQLHSTKDRVTAIRTLARIHSSLMKPVPFNQIGALRKGEKPGEYTVGSMFFRDGADYGGPYKDLNDWWQCRLYELVLAAVSKWCKSETDVIPKSRISPEASPQDFASLLPILAGVTSYVLRSISADMTRLVLIHADLAVRNVVFDKTDLNKVVAVLDWTGSFIGPAVLAARAVDDLMTRHNSPVCQPGFRWRSVPHDWTSYAGTTNESSASGRVSWNVRATYLRRFYASIIASEVGMDMATLFEDARVVQCLHEMTWDATYLFRNELWLRETYWRLRKVLEKKIVGHEGLLLHTPKAFKHSLQREEINLAESEEKPLPRSVALKLEETGQIW